MSSTIALESKKKLNPKAVVVEKLKMLVFIVILGTLSATLLVTLESYTMKMVLANVGAELQSGVLDVFALEYTAETSDRVFADNITVEPVGEVILYRAANGSIASRFNGEGLWGPIAGIVALSSDMKTIDGVIILEQQETPGLGGRIVETEFLSQFKGVEVEPQLVIKKGGEAAGKGNEVDGITGATMTSKALENMLNNHITNVRQLLGVK
ncbi:MAG: FMN-binding protein [Dethiobacter sp.]|nr:FMN-binding protein [Dethiobacter sp.]